MIFIDSFFKYFFKNKECLFLKSKYINFVSEVCILVLKMNHNYKLPLLHQTVLLYQTAGF